MREQARLAVDEVPVLASRESSAHWTLITTSRVFLMRAGETRVFDWSELSDATVDLKQHMHRLTLVCVDGERVPLELEAGPPFFAFWNVLKTIVAMKTPR